MLNTVNQVRTTPNDPDTVIGRVNSSSSASPQICLSRFPLSIRYHLARPTRLPSPVQPCNSVINFTLAVLAEPRYSLRSVTSAYNRRACHRTLACVSYISRCTPAASKLSRLTYICASTAARRRRHSTLHVNKPTCY